MRKGTDMTWRSLAAGLACAGVVVLAGCGSSGPSAAQRAARAAQRAAAQQEHAQAVHAKAACVALAAAAVVFDDSYGQGGLAGTITSASTWVGALDKALRAGYGGGTQIIGVDPVNGYYPVKMTTDLEALTGLSGFPLETSAAQASALQGDCDSAGITAPVWPQYPITP